MAVLVLVLFCLFRPVLVVKAAVPQQNFLGILMDDSRSMQIADQNAAPRGGVRQAQFSAPDAAVLKALADRFMLRTFRFSSSASRVGLGRRADVCRRSDPPGAALDGARQELAGLPLAGLVVVSDGADTDRRLAARRAARAEGGVGAGLHRRRRHGKAAKDIQIGRVTTPRTALKGTSLMIDVVITQTGFAGEAVTLDVEDEGRIVGSQAVKLPVDGEPAAVRVRFTASQAGPRVFRFKIAPQAGEIVTQNNPRDAMIEVRDRRERMLYFEGEPRPEMRFIRRAVEDDKNLAGRHAAANRGQQVHAARRRQDRRSSSPASRRREKSCSPIAASSSAASRRARSPAISCG